MTSQDTAGEQASDSAGLGVDALVGMLEPALARREAEAKWMAVVPRLLDLTSEHPPDGAREAVASCDVDWPPPPASNAWDMAARLAREREWTPEAVGWALRAWDIEHGLMRGRQALRHGRWERRLEQLYEAGGEWERLGVRLEEEPGDPPLLWLMVADSVLTPAAANEPEGTRGVLIGEYSALLTAAPARVAVMRLTGYFIPSPSKNDWAAIVQGLVDGVELRPELRAAWPQNVLADYIEAARDGAPVGGARHYEIGPEGDERSVFAIRPSELATYLRQSGERVFTLRYVERWLADWGWEQVKFKPNNERRERALWVDGEGKGAIDAVGG